MMKKGDRNPKRGNGPTRRSIHAQTGSKAQIPMRTQRQSLLLVGSIRRLMSNLFHDSQQTFELVEESIHQNLYSYTLYTHFLLSGLYLNIIILIINFLRGQI